MRKVTNISLHMQDTKYTIPYQIRLSQEEKNLYESQKERDGFHSLAPWIRHVLNERVRKSIK